MPSSRLYSEKSFSDVSERRDYLKNEQLELLKTVSNEKKKKLQQKEMEDQGNRMCTIEVQRRANIMNRNLEAISKRNEPAIKLKINEMIHISNRLHMLGARKKKISYRVTHHEYYRAIPERRLLALNEAAYYGPIKKTAENIAALTSQYAPTPLKGSALNSSQLKESAARMHGRHKILQQHHHQRVQQVLAAYQPEKKLLTEKELQRSTKRLFTGSKGS